MWSDSSENSNVSSSVVETPDSSPVQQVPQYRIITVDDEKSLHCEHGKPRLRIITQPESHFRYRYKSERYSGTHGCLKGEDSSADCKTSPTVELTNYSGKAVIKCQLYQADADEEHPHTLREEEELQDHQIQAQVPEDGSYIVRFPDMGIIHLRKKDVPMWLFNKYPNNEIDENELLQQCKQNAKEINLNVVRLRFSAHDVDTDAEICPPVFSRKINNIKSATTNELKIVYYSRTAGPATGGPDMVLFTSKVNSSNVKVRFYELDGSGKEIWTTTVEIFPNNVHHQYAMKFSIPAYKDTKITKNVNVLMEIFRPSDGTRSEAKKFEYVASRFDAHKAQSKKRKLSESDDSICPRCGASTSKNIFETMEQPVKTQDVKSTQTSLAQVSVHHPSMSSGFGQLTQEITPSTSKDFFEGMTNDEFVPDMVISPQQVIQSITQSTIASLKNSPSTSTQNNHVYFIQNPSTFQESNQVLQTTDPLFTEYINPILPQSTNPLLPQNTNLLFPQNTNLLLLQNANPLPQNTNPVLTETSTNDMMEHSDCDEYVQQLMQDENFRRCVDEYCDENVEDFPWLQLNPDSGRGKGETSTSGKSKTNKGKKASYMPEEIDLIRTAVKEICTNYLQNKVKKRQEIRDKLQCICGPRFANGDTLLHVTLRRSLPSFMNLVKIINSMNMKHLLNLTNDRLETILHCAIIKDLPDIVGFLIQNGCDPMVRDYEGNTAVHLAAIGENTLESLLEAVLKHNVYCDLDACNLEKETALHVAVSYGAERSVRLLLKHGARATPDLGGRWPIHRAADPPRPNLLRVLLEHNSTELNIVDDRDLTPLQIVCCADVTEKSLESVNILLEKGADPFAREKGVKSAWKLAAGKNEIRALMREVLISNASNEELSDNQTEDEYESAEEGEYPEEDIAIQIGSMKL